MLKEMEMKDKLIQKSAKIKHKPNFAPLSSPLQTNMRISTSPSAERGRRSSCVASPERR